MKIVPYLHKRNKNSRTFKYFFFYQRIYVNYSSFWFSGVGRTSDRNNMFVSCLLLGFQWLLNSLVILNKSLCYFEWKQQVNTLFSCLWIWVILINRRISAPWRHWMGRQSLRCVRFKLQRLGYFVAFLLNQLMVCRYWLLIYFHFFITFSLCPTKCNFGC